MTSVPEINPSTIDHDKLQDVSFDPFGLMPRDFPPHPRVFVTAQHLTRARRLAKTRKWAAFAMERLLADADKPYELPDKLPTPADPKVNGEVVGHATRNALVHLLTGKEEYRERAVCAFRLFARHYVRWPIVGENARAFGNSLSEAHSNQTLGETYDLLAAAGLEAEDDALFRQMLAGTREVLNGRAHSACSNHNTWNLAGRLAIASALGDMQGVHDTLYGCEGNVGWRYGLIHQLRHDILADGIHWERTVGYLYYSLMGFVELAWIFANVGVDIWHAELPTQTENDGKDLHRAYGPEGKTKCLKAMFDAPFYQMFANGDLSLLHDSGLANIRGAWVWGVIYELAYEAYGDPKYAWLLNRIQKQYTEREHPELPMSLHASHGLFNFVRLGRVSYPKGCFSLAEDCTISLAGKHTGGCSLFPTQGSAVLRSDPKDEMAPGVYMFWGPHTAGHQNPAALHIDMHARGARLTDAARSGGYSDSMHMTWARTTIAHNTVTVDETAMFPCDQENDTMWEADSWRERPSDGVLELFQSGGAVKAVRASNESVYPGVRLDRTVVLTPEFVVDVFRVLSEDEHQYDWAMHCVGSLVMPGDAESIDLGQRRGYGHFSDAKELKSVEGVLSFRCERGENATSAQVIIPDGGRVITASDPREKDKDILGELEEYIPRSTILVRATGGNVVFVSLWQFDPTSDLETKLSLVDGRPDGDIVLGIGKRTLSLPVQPHQVTIR